MRGKSRSTLRIWVILVEEGRYGCWEVKTMDAQIGSNISNINFKTQNYLLFLNYRLLNTLKYNSVQFSCVRFFATP